VTAAVPTPTRTRYHGPAWELTHKGRGYLVWAPGGDRGRTQWAAAWDSLTGTGRRGGFRRGATLADVLVIFPEGVATAFVMVIVAEGWS
jgi:hypothetical protein